MQLQRSAPAITLEELQAWEQSLGVALPEEFITLYMGHNTLTRLIELAEALELD